MDTSLIFHSSISSAIRRTSLASLLFAVPLFLLLIATSVSYAEEASVGGEPLETDEVVELGVVSPSVENVVKSVRSESVPKEFRSQTYLLAGLRVAPGLFHVNDMKWTRKYKSIKSYDDYFAGAQLQAGVMQSFLPEIELSGEIFFGGVFVNEINLVRERKFAGLRPNLGLELVLRYLPVPQYTQFYLACSIGAQWIFLSERSYTAFGPSLRLGWQTMIDSHKLIFELGYTTPFISGVSGKTPILTAEGMEDDSVDSRLHQVFASVIFAI